MLSAWAPEPTRFTRNLSFAGLLAIAALMPAASRAADTPAAPAVEAEEADEPSEPEPKRVPPGERPFWEAVLLMSSDDAEKQKRGREKLLEAGDLEYVPAQTYLGECFLRGQDGFPKSERKAAAWFRLAADRGDATAQVYLGTCYLLGKGVPTDRAKAKAVLVQAAASSAGYQPPTPPPWFLEERAKEAQPAAKAGDGSEPARDGPVAMAPTAAPWEFLLGRGYFILGLIQEEGRDYVGALASFEKAAGWGSGGRAGIADAAARAARCYALGRGCTRDLARANELLARSRDLRRSGDMAELHSMWTNRRVDDFLLAELEKQSSAEADAHLTEDQQDVAAALQKENPAEALRWCEMSASAGEGWAMIELAEILRTGRAGAADTKGAFDWYIKAKDSGQAWVAKANLVVCYKRGIGTAVDEAAAATLVDEAGEDNFAVALAAAGHVPPGSWTAAGWWAFLDAQARVAKLPLARYYAAVRDFERLSASGDTKIDVKQKDVIKAMRRAAEEGFRGAHFYLALMMLNGWDSSGTQEKYEAALKKGAELGDLHAMVNYAILVADRDGSANLRRAIELNLEVIRRDPDNANAHNNLAVDMRALAKMGLSMEGIRDVVGEAIKHLERAEELGSAKAAKNLAECYTTGDGVERDVRMAYTYYQSAAEKGDTESNRILGNMHEKGLGVPVTPREAMYYYRIAALDGDVEALKAVCDFYLQGRGVERDLEAAKVWLVRLAQTGNVIGIITFGDVLLRQKQYVEARKFWTSLVDSYHLMIRGAANERLSRIYRDGLGVKANPRKAEKYYRDALELRNPDALCRQGRELIVAGKVAEGVAVLEKSGDSTGEALFLLGSIRVAGQGVPKDVATGLKNFQQASQLGHLNAKYMLAVATLKNLPGAPSLDEAARLLEEAEAAGLTKAAELRPTVEAKRAKAAGAPTDAGRAGSG